MDKTTKYILIAGAILLVLYFVSQSQKKSATVNSTSLSGTGGILAGIGGLVSGVGKGIGSIWGKSASASEGEFEPDISSQIDATLG